jgi:hypothetical protein
MTTLNFGQGGSAYPYLVDGWSGAEANFRWSFGRGASMTADIPQGEGDLFLELSLNPFIPTGQRSRSLRVTVDGRTVGADSLEGEGVVGYLVPPDITGPRVLIGLHHDPAPSLATLGLSTDTRSLGFMVRSLRFARYPNRPRADVTVLPPLAIPDDSARRPHAIRATTGLTPRALAERFESLGHNCEFGMVQRHLEAEPLGLLRFAGITLDDLLLAFDEDFVGLGRDIAVSIGPDLMGGQEYVVLDRRYRIGMHTNRGIDSDTAAEIMAQYRTHLPFLAQHLRGRIAEGSHIHVFQRPGQLTHSQAVPLWNRLLSHGPGALLYVDQDPSLPSGAVEQRGPGLFHGKLARLAPQEKVGQVDLAGWLSVLANAYRLWAR